MRFLLATLWVLIGAALTAGVYWGFLVTPESTIGTLIVSALLALVALAAAGLTANGTIAIWTHGASVAGMRHAARAIPSVIPAGLIVLLVWWITDLAETWVAMRAGQIIAWSIANFGREDLSWFFTTIRYGAEWLRWVIAPLLALSLMAAIVGMGWKSIAQAAWIRRAFRLRAVAIATLCFVLFIALPWIYLVPWRPKGLPPSSIEFAFIVAKLSVSAILMAMGLALITQTVAASPAPPPTPTIPAVPAVAAS